MMNNKTKAPSKPTIPIEIVNAIDNKKLLIFVGAGISRLYGYPGWNELGTFLIKKAINEGILSYSEKETLLSGDFSPMEIVTIMSNKFESMHKNLGVANIVKELSEDKNNNKRLSNKIAKYLSAYNSLIITTNADTSLDDTKYFKERVKVYNFEKYKPGPHNFFSFIHLHGCIREPNSLIFTSEQYARAYTIDSDFGRNLSSLFNDNEWVILFLGYGVNEFELIRYFIKNKNPTSKKMFLIEGYLDKDYVKYGLDDEYYASLGIKLIRYSREKKNYMGLVDVLQAWNKDVKKRTLAGSVTKQKIINDIVSQSPTTESVTIITNLVNKNG